MRVGESGPTGANSLRPAMPQSLGPSEKSVLKLSQTDLGTTTTVVEEVDHRRHGPTV